MTAPAAAFARQEQVLPGRAALRQQRREPLALDSARVLHHEAAEPRELGEDDVMELLGRASEDGASLFDEAWLVPVDRCWLVLTSQNTAGTGWQMLAG